jgi:hypothetical protein
MNSFAFINFHIQATDENGKRNLELHHKKVIPWALADLIYTLSLESEQNRTSSIYIMSPPVAAPAAVCSSPVDFYDYNQSVHNISLVQLQ